MSFDLTPTKERGAKLQITPFDFQSTLTSYKYNQKKMNEHYVKITASENAEEWKVVLDQVKHLVIKTRGEMMVCKALNSYIM